MSSNIHPDSKLVLKQLVADAKSGGLVLFIGAGVNATAVHQWKHLLDDLLQAALSHAALYDHNIARRRDKLSSWCAEKLDACARATLVKKILGSARYHLELQRALYCKKPDIIRNLAAHCRKARSDRTSTDFGYLRSVASLCQKPQVKAVLTFNFDTLLETAINEVPGKRKVRVHPPSVPLQIPSPMSESEVPLFYVHGRVPPPGGFLHGRFQSLVFASEEYLERQSDPLGWETSTPLHFLRSYCSLWLGTSLADWDMLRLLDAARKSASNTRAYCIQSLEGLTDHNTATSCKPADLEYTSAAIRLQVSLLDVVGVHLINAGPRYDDISALLRSSVTEQLPNGPRDISAS